MNTNIRVENNKIIFDGHASNIEQCNVITNICNALNSSNNFKTIKYENGYAEFEILNQASELKFAAAPSNLTLIFDSGVSSVTFTDSSGKKTITSSGTTIETLCNDGQEYSLSIIPKKLYKVVSVKSGLGSGVIAPYVDRSNQIIITAGAGGIDGSITITTVKNKRIVQPKVKNADGTYDDLIIHESINSTNATNSISLPDGSFGKLEADENGVLKFGNIIIPQEIFLYKPSEPTSITSDSEGQISLNGTLKAGDIIEIKYTYSPYSGGYIIKRFCISVAASYYMTTGYLDDVYYVEITGGLDRQSNISKMENNSNSLKFKVHKRLSEDITSNITGGIGSSTNTLKIHYVKKIIC